jgi:hypothetical protein
MATPLLRRFSIVIWTYARQIAETTSLHLVRCFRSVVKPFYILNESLFDNKDQTGRLPSHILRKVTFLESRVLRVRCCTQIKAQHLIFALISSTVERSRWCRNIALFLSRFALASLYLEVCYQRNCMEWTVKS